MQTLDTPVTSVLIETVDNGFIVYENYQDRKIRKPYEALITKRLVFNTQRQLNKYLNKTIVPKQNEKN